MTRDSVRDRAFQAWLRDWMNAAPYQRREIRLSEYVEQFQLVNERLQTIARSA